MKFSLASFIKYKGPSIVLLLCVIVISLALSDIPCLVRFIHGKNKSLEGMTTDNSITTIDKILSDKYASNSQKMAGIKAIVDMMDNGKDQTQYNSILTDETKSDTQKIEGINELVEKYMNSTEKAKKDMSGELKGEIADAKAVEKAAANSANANANASANA